MHVCVKYYGYENVVYMSLPPESSIIDSRVLPKTL